MSAKWKELVQEYKNTCTIPKHPKKCPDCDSKVSIYHVNLEEAIFMCSKEECLWPLAGTHKPEEVLGKSNSSILGQIKDEKRRMDKETESFENVFMNTIYKIHSISQVIDISKNYTCENTF